MKRTVRVKRWLISGKVESERWTLLKLLLRIDIAATCIEKRGGLPSRAVVNDYFKSGQGQEVMAGLDWKPFTVSPAEYGQMQQSYRRIIREGIFPRAP